MRRPGTTRKESTIAMKKRNLLSGLLVLVLLATIMPLALAASTNSGSQPDAVPVYIDGQLADLGADSIMLNGTTYVSLRGFSMAMGASNVTWYNGTATVYAPDLTVTATVGNIYLVANDRYLFVADGCILYSDSMMVPVRVLAEAFNASVAWSNEGHAVYVTSGSGAIESGSTYYDETDLYWMARIITAEARGESFEGQIAVGGVIMNRITSSEFPDTVYDVVFDRRYGVQFTPAYSGAIYNTPTESCIIAAKIALDGGNTAGDSLYFSSSSVGCWAARSRPYTMTIGNHSFYA